MDEQSKRKKAYAKLTDEQLILKVLLQMCRRHGYGDDDLVEEIKKRLPAEIAYGP